MAIRFGPKTNFEIESLKLSAVVNTDSDVKLIAVPAHHPIKWACIRNAASHSDNNGPNKDKIGADVIIGWTPNKTKIHTIKGSRIIIAHKGKLFPTLFDIKF